MRLLFAWEMGHNYGHATQIAALARSFAARKKTEIFLAFKSPDGAVSFANDFPCRILQAPYHPIRPGKNLQSETYAEGLLPCGYARADDLHPLIECWRTMYDLIKPDALIAQAAPTALLAARGHGFKKFSFGRSFDVPPLSTPMRPFQYWKKHDEKLFARSEQKITQTINESLKRAGMKPVASFKDAIESDGDFLCAFKDLDHYPERGNTKYYGPFFESEKGAEVKWRKGAKHRIFAYLQPGHPIFKVALRALQSLPENYDVILAAPNIPEEARQKSETKFLRIIPGAVRLKSILKDCDIAIQHGGGGLASALALAGVPALTLPLHIEQVMSARAIGRAKLGLGLMGQITPADIVKKIDVLISDPQYKSAALAFAKKYADYDPSKTANEIAKIIEQEIKNHR
jgi:UDP:flavonoid glycosyltransferase YjiC (YdhE family)